jgi:hypothetical protein
MTAVWITGSSSSSAGTTRGAGPGKHNLRDVPASQIAKVFEDLIFSEVCGGLHPLISKNALKLLQEEGG